MELVEMEPLMRPVWSMSGSDMLTTLDAVHSTVSTLLTYRLQLMAGLDQIGHAQEIGARDTVQLLAYRHRLDVTEVRRDLKLANALPKYAMVSAALPDPFAPTSPDGTIQYAEPATRNPSADGAEEPAADPTTGPSQEPAADATTSRGEEPAVGFTVAPGEDPAADPSSPPTDNPDRDADADSDGAGEGGGGAAERLPVLLHPAQAEAIVTALERVPTAAMVPVENLLAAEEQMVEAARYLAPMDLRKLGKRVRDILDTDGPEPAEEKARAREALWLKNADQGVKFGGYLANENAELLRTLIHAGAKPHKTVDGELDPRPRDKRQADALTTILNTAARGEAVPGHGGAKAHISVTIDFNDLKNNTGTGDLIFGDSLSAAAVRRLACDAGVIPIVLGSDSQPLDVGREERYVTGAIRNALNLRDKGCVVCGAPPANCEAHHLIHWANGGATALYNRPLLQSPPHRHPPRPLDHPHHQRHRPRHPPRLGRPPTRPNRTQQNRGQQNRPTPRRR